MGKATYLQRVTLGVKWAYQGDMYDIGEYLSPVQAMCV